jgi:SAM-dependent methyltransferase
LAHGAEPGSLISIKGAACESEEKCNCYDVRMLLPDAIEMLADSKVDALGPTTWADLGCGDGTFTLALATLLAAGSTIHAMDRDSSALRGIPSTHNDVRINTHRGDFTKRTWPFADLDGILMANSLHYVADQAAFIRACEERMTSKRRFLIVEYDTNDASRWVPNPLSQARLTAMFASAGYSSVRILGSRPSIYRRASLYAAVIVSSNGIHPATQENL